MRLDLNVVQRLGPAIWGVDRVVQKEDVGATFSDAYIFFRTNNEQSQKIQWEGWEFTCAELGDMSQGIVRRESPTALAINDKVILDFKEYTVYAQLKKWKENGDFDGVMDEAEREGDQAPVGFTVGTHPAHIPATNPTSQSQPMTQRYPPAFGGGEVVDLGSGSESS